jgi:hypothetical protein
MTRKVTSKAPCGPFGLVCIGTSSWSASERNAQAPESDKIATLAEIVHSDHAIWEKKYTDLEGLGAEYGARVVKAYEDVIAHVEKQVFEGIKLPRTLKTDLRKTVSFMYGKQWFPPPTTAAS